VHGAPLSRPKLTDRPRSGDTIDVETAGRLKAAYGSFGKPAVAAVDRSRGESGRGQLTLEQPHRSGSAGPVSITRTKNEPG
jgi:hypothetical protein